MMTEDEIKRENEKVPGMNLSVRVQVHKENDDGTRELVVDKPSNSWVLAFIDLLNGAMSQTTRTIPDTGGTGRAVALYEYRFACEGSLAGGAGDGLTTGGIVLGTGTTAVALADDSIETLIAHGTGADQLYYHECIVGAPVTDPAGTRKFVISRTVRNYSGGTITVKEQALYVRGYSGAYYFCIDHTGGLNVAVGDDAAYTFEYIIGVTV